MIWQACLALGKHAPINDDPFAPLLPSLDAAQDVAKHIAVRVAKQAIEENIARANTDVDLVKLIDKMFWEPRYLPYKRKGTS